MSVKRKVTVPLGSSAMTLAASLRPDRHDAYSAPIIVTSEAWARRKKLQRTRLGDRLGARLVSVVPGQRQGSFRNTGPGERLLAGECARLALDVRAAPASASVA